MNQANAWRRKKHRAGKKRKFKKNRQRSYLATLEAEQAASQETTPEPETEGVGEITETALFERQAEAIPDAAMTRQAIRERWSTPKPLSERVLVKALTLAAGDEWVQPDGKVRREEWSPPQLIGAAKLALDIERQNQGQDHHVDRMDYHERALQMRAKVGDYTPPAGAGLKIETEGKATVTLYLPNNGRSEPDDLLNPADVIDD